MTRTTIATAVTASALAAALLSGCGGGGQPAAGSSSMPNVAPAPSSATSSSAPATSSPTSSKPSRSVEMAGAPGVPKPARMHTKAGAEAFARHYVHLVNVTGVHPKPGKLERLGVEGCESCKNYAGNVRYLVQHHEHNSGRAARVKQSASRRLDSDVRAWVLIDQLPIQVLDSDGTAVGPQGLVKNVALVFDVKWLPTKGWRVREIQIDQSGAMPS